MLQGQLNSSRFFWLLLLLIHLAAALLPGVAHGQGNLLKSCTVYNVDSSLYGSAIWLKALPGDPVHHYRWSNGSGTIDFYDDSSAHITGRVHQIFDPSRQWDLDIWLVDGLDYATYVAGGGSIITDQAPPGVVAANQQDWTFYEFDSLRSAAYGVPGSFFAGDTIRLSHRPVDRAERVQVGIGANAANGQLGIYGQFFFTGDHVGFGCLVNIIDCNDSCDVSILDAEPICLDQQTFEVNVTISSSNTGLQLTDNLGLTNLPGLSSGTYTVGPYQVGDTVVFTLTDPNGLACDTFSMPVFAGCDTLCDVALAAVTPQCLNSGTFQVLIDLTGSGTYTISDNQGTAPLTGQSAGSGIAFGTYPNNTPVIIYVVDEQATGCGDTTQVVTLDCASTCSLTLSSFSSACLNPNLFEITLTFAGSGLSYDIFDQNGNLLQANVAPGTVILGPFATGDTIQPRIVDVNDPFCEAVAPALTEDCSLPPGCTISLDSLSTVCVSPDSFNVRAFFSGNASSYDLLVNGTAVLSGIAPDPNGYDLGNFANNQLVLVRVVDVNSPLCEASGLATDSCGLNPPPGCTLDLTALDAVCVSPDSFNVGATFTGSASSYDIFVNGSLALSGVAPGQYGLGNFPSGQLVIVRVVDANDAACEDFASVSDDCTGTPLPCDLALDSASATCVSVDSFAIAVGFSGTGTLYDITVGGILVQDDVPAGSYSLGNFASGSSQTVVITDVNDGTCVVDTTLSANCPALCDLDLTATPVCVNSDSFRIDFTLTGGGLYTVSDDQGSPVLTGLGDGTYSIGPYANGTVVRLDASDEDFPGCIDSVLALTEDCGFLCDLALDSASAACVSVDSFAIAVGFSGTGTLYDITVGGILVQDDVPAGSYSLGNFASGSSQTVVITDVNDGTCVVDTTLSANCPALCDLDLTATPVCVNSDSFRIDFTLTGGGLYTVSDDQGSPVLTGLGDGTYSIGPYANGNVVRLDASDETFPGCIDSVLALTEDCGFLCNLALDSASAACVSVDSFAIAVGFSGTGTLYDITVGGILVQDDVPAGSYSLGNFASGSSQTVVITDVNDGTCVVDTTLSANCPALCDLDLTATPVCVNSDSFRIDFTLTGGGLYTVSDDQGSPVLTGLGDGTYSIGPYANGNVVRLDASDETFPGCIDSVLTLTEDCSVLCDLALDSASAACVSVDSFAIAVGFSGTGTLYDITVGGILVQDDVPAGSYSLGNFASGSSQTVVITDVNDGTCVVDTTLSANCPALCDLDLTATPVCVNSDSFRIDFTLTGGGLYTVSDDQGSPVLTGLGDGTYSIGPYANGNVVRLDASDETFPGCIDSVLTLTEDCGFLCDLALDSASAACVSVDSFAAAVAFTGNSSAYDILVNGTLVQNNVSAGLQPLGTFPTGSMILIRIIDQDDPTCELQTILMADCPAQCDLGLTATPVCVNSDSFRIDFTLTGDGLYAMGDDQGSSILTGLSAGTYPIGPYANGTVVKLRAEDLTFPGCVDSVENLTEDCSFLCDLSIDSAIANCFTVDSFATSLTFSGNSSGYDILVNGTTVFNNVPAGTYSFGNQPTSTALVVRIIDQDDPTCEAQTVLTADCQALCDLSLSATAVCDTISGGFFINVQLSGNGGYRYSDDGGLTFQPIDTGSTQLGLYPNGAVVDLIVQDILLGGCADTVLGLTEDCSFLCDLSLDSSSVTCVTVDSFEAQVSFSGSSVYDITVDGTLVGNNVAPGSPFFLGTYPSSTAQTVVITDAFDSTCSVSTVLSQDCQALCDLSLSATAVCDTISGGFFINVQLSGNGGYRYSDDGGLTFQPIDTGSTQLGLYPNGAVVDLIVQDILLGGCADTVLGLTEDCSFLCDLSLDSSSVTCVTVDSFEAQVSFSGSSVYDITVDGTLVGNNVAPGSPFFLGTYPSSTAQTVVITDAFDSTCSVSTVLSQDCQALCDLTVSASTACDSFGLGFNINLQVNGNGGYRYSDDGGNSFQPLLTGLTQLGLYPNGDTIDLIVQDTLLGGCADTLFGLTDDCPIPCLLTTTFIDSVCDSITARYSVLLEIAGLPGTYEISDINGSVPDTVQLTGSGGPTAAIFQYGDYQTSTVSLLRVRSLDVLGCRDSIGPLSVDCGASAACTIPEFDVSIECITPDSFQVSIVLTDGTDSVHQAMLFVNGSPVGTQGNVFVGDTVNFSASIVNGAFTSIQVMNLTTPTPCENDTAFSNINCQTAFPPPNDNCTNATPLPCGTSSGTFLGASGGDAPFDSCGGTALQGPGVWYTVEGTGDSITATTCSSSPLFDTRIFIFTGNCNGFSCVAANDDNPNCFFGTSEVTFATVPGQTYYLYLTDPDTTGFPFQVTIVCQQGSKGGPSLNLRPLPSDEGVILQWEIPSELGLDGYQIERSLDSVLWESIDWIERDGILDTMQRHRYRDESVELHRRYYYRIRAMDLDGGYRFSNVESILLRGEDAAVIGDLFPNPARTSVKVPLEVFEHGTLTWQLIDARGVVLRQDRMRLEQGTHEIELDVTWLIDGTYWLRLQYGETGETRKLMIVR